MAMAESLSRSQGALDTVLLLEIMKKLGELRPEQNMIHTTDDFFDLAPSGLRNAQELSLLFT
jgi:hypothetical protein